MTRQLTQTRRSAASIDRLIFRWFALGVVILAGLVALLSGSPVTADSVAATATVCVPGPDNFCPATPTSQPLPLRLYLAEIQRTDGTLP